MEIIYDRLCKTKKGGTVGINIGANKNTKDKLSDCKIGIKKFSTIADYITINISSQIHQVLEIFSRSTFPRINKIN